jgi:hypothetical protein
VAHQNLGGLHGGDQGDGSVGYRFPLATHSRMVNAPGPHGAGLMAVIGCVFDGSGSTDVAGGTGVVGPGDGSVADGDGDGSVGSGSGDGDGDGGPGEGAGGVPGWGVSSALRDLGVPPAPSRAGAGAPVHPPAGGAIGVDGTTVMRMTCW